MPLIKKIFAGTIQPIIAKKIYRTSYYKWKDITLRIPPGVFHPKYFFSTKYLLKYVLQLDIKNKNLLELGAGNGLISIACAKQGAKVTATDVSKRVIETLHENTKSNKAEITIIESDLFDQIPKQQFDIIAINPPYYPKTPKNELEKAWYCGEHFEYFEKLFYQLKLYLHGETILLMVLSEDCNLEKIFAIAKKNGFNFTLAQSKTFYWEKNFIFNIHL